MVESIHELKKKVQEPVRAYNDVAGVLVGDRVAIHVTRLFLALGLSPTVGTVGMLVCGLVGSALLVLGGGWSVLGFGLLFVYYVFDCVDGEVARYRQCERLQWGFHDFLFHLYVKAAFFSALGIYAVRATGEWWVAGFALSALLATLFGKALYDAALVLTARYVLLRTSSERARFTREILGDPATADLEHDGDLPGEQQPFTVGRKRGLARAVLTNFDLSILWFLLAAVIDLFHVPPVVLGLEVDLKCALLAFYGVVLPLDFADRVWTYVRNDGFRRDARRVLRRAHHYRAR
ncbi:MAG: CDP-alcohol phosphatidyltransferase family protein [Planctomycetes bacterium]|nr:CDP-alcohol phosphatidyltransferase family protein [Planctomycetota bacterium]